PSHFFEGRAYVALDAHRSNDDEPYIFVTEDYGQTWKSLRANLPSGSTRVCREDIQNPELLYTGTEFGVWVSANRGAAWTRLNSNLPTVAVHELAQHPTSGELVAATHGRSLWVLDVTPLRQMTAAVILAKAHLFQPNTVIRWRLEEGRERMFSGADRKFVGQNPPPGVQVFYSLTKKPAAVSLKVMDYTGTLVSELPANSELGLHWAVWNLNQGRGRPAARRSTPATRVGAATGRPPAATVQPGTPLPLGEQETIVGQPFSFGGGQQVKPGVYRVVLTVDGAELAQWVRVEPDPSEAATIITTGQDGKP